MSSRLLIALYSPVVSDLTSSLSIGCQEYSVPLHIRDHVELIKPTVHFNHRAPPTNNRVSKRSAHLGAASSFNGPKTNGAKVTHNPSLAECDEFITLDSLRALYSIQRTPKMAHKNTYGIGKLDILVSTKADLQVDLVEFTPQAFLASDLDLFFKNFSSSQIGSRPTLVSIDGGKLLVPPICI